MCLVNELNALIIHNVRLMLPNDCQMKPLSMSAQQLHQTAISDYHACFTRAECRWTAIKFVQFVQICAELRAKREMGPWWP